MAQKKKLGFTVLSAALAVSALAGCSGGTDNAGKPAGTGGAKEASAPASGSGGTGSGLDTSKKVELQFYMLGDAPKDLPVIQAEINKLAEKDLNATVKFNYTSWTDWDQKYKLLLSSGQQVDLIFTADWTQYQSYAKKGAFQPLDELLPKAAPKLNGFVPKDMWEAVKIDGKIYTVPATYKEYVTNGFVYREDLRAKYNLPKPTSIETYEAYLDGIKKNEPDMLPLASTSNPVSSLSDPFRELTRDPVGGPLPYGIGIKYSQPGEAYSYWGSPEHLEELQTMKRWMDKGFFPKNVLNNKDTLTDQLTSGKAASIFGDNPTRFNDSVIKIASTHPDWKLEYYPFPLSRGFATPVHPIHNGFAIPKSSKNAERALAFYEKLVTDKQYNLLTQYGIEGKNYTVENGYYKMVGDKNSNGFGREAMNGWAWRNPEYMLFDKGYDNVKKIFSELDKIQKPDIFTGFAEDYTSYQAEKAALEQVTKQYLYPLQAGLLPDVETGLKTFLEKAKQAGLDKVQGEYKKQWAQYVKDKGIK
ncbi:family 1 extracellular solute-binding protein [Paenibacillus mucilaginosus 3016]|uniref:Family 1 extracellular solute-binding protein n=1 Tax=Paenibacillus mucilaginosus 3016 TaxID=1116391 RepID=H6NRE2_9BACL|nr:extracellular solute-binding protein [Paenibacillus mucilaginosus]AFC33577.1 family 1 extracellular solute-binding protein [Paenibacillus mucilaginosus 3016]WFA21977.1 extracellular solute-binding protein [Paenibacillus mucilaginosus]